jgi:acyl dehydratase
VIMLGPKVHALSDLSEGVRASVEFSITAEQMEQFALLSGDCNPLHTDEEFARRKGFQGRVVYGALLVAKVSQLIGMELPGRDSVWASVSFDFRKPLFVDQPAEAEGVIASVSESTGLVELNLTVRAAGKLLARGRAEVVVAG